jgi:hypothetical protein
MEAIRRLQRDGCVPPYSDEARLLGLADSWCEIMADMPDDAVMAGVVALIADGGTRYGWPPSGVVRQRAIGLVRHVTGHTLMGAEQAWGYVLGLASAGHGRGDDPVTGDTAAGVTTSGREIIVTRTVPGGWVTRAGKRVDLPAETRTETRWAWALHDDAEQRRHLEAGVDAVGGWASIRRLPSSDIVLVGHFRRAYEASVTGHADGASAMLAVEGPSLRLVEGERPGIVAWARGGGE